MGEVARLINPVAELIERDEEMTALRTAIETAHLGQRSLIVASAPAGMGKTSLLDAARTLAADAGRDLWRQAAANWSGISRSAPSVSSSTP